MAESAVVGVLKRMTETGERFSVEPKPVIDTSKMSSAQREALELTEAAREAAEAERGFSGGLFMGRFNLARIHPFPLQSLWNGKLRDSSNITDPNLSVGNRNDFLDAFHLSVRLKHGLYVHSDQTFRMIMQRVDEQLLVRFFELSNYL